MEDFKERLNNKNKIIEEKNDIIDNKNKEIEELNEIILSLTKRINTHSSIVADFNFILEAANKKIDLLEKEKNQWVTDRINQQQVITQQLGNSDNIISQLQNELITTQDRLKKYEKVD